MRSIYYYLTKANRISAWLLVALFIVYGITGYVWTRGQGDRGMAIALHSSLTLPLIILLSFHSLYSLRIMLCGWGIGPKRWLDSLLIGFGLFSIGSTVYIMYVQ